VYTVMEACHGPTLAKLLQVANGAVSNSTAALLLLKTALAVMQLHSIGVLHRARPNMFNLLFGMSAHASY
jgi:serine/threonine protein kinase